MILDYKLSNIYIYIYIYIIYLIMCIWTLYAYDIWRTDINVTSFLLSGTFDEWFQWSNGISSHSPRLNKKTGPCFHPGKIHPFNLMENGICWPLKPLFEVCTLRFCQSPSTILPLFTIYWIGICSVFKNCLVVWNIFYFSIYWKCHHPNWLSDFSEG